MSTIKANTHTDEILVEHLLSTGNPIYFEQLYQRYFQKVFYQTLSYLKDQEEAQDVTQDIFVKLYDRLGKFKGKSRFSTWLFAFARNAVLDYLRTKGRLKEDHVEESKLENVPEVEDEELFQIRSDHLALVLDQIPHDDKAILIMKYAHDWQIEEIAEQMGMGSSAIKMRLKRAKAKVLQLYQQTYRE